jgi:hypothetical protein
MKSRIKSILSIMVAAIALTTFASNVQAQFKMDSGGKINKSSGATAGKIASDGITISGANGETLGKVSSDGKTISNKNGATVLKISGTTISNANGATVGTMSDVTRSISGAKAEPIYVGLWWFVVKGNK